LIRRGSLAILAVLVLAGCRQDMHDQPKYEPFEESGFFADGQASRLPVEGAVARGLLRDDSLYYEGLTAQGELAPAVPIELDAAVLARGQETYNAFCSPCHDRLGTGNGMIVQRGFKQPESFQSLRLRQSPPGYFFQVMTNGFAEMSSYAAQVSVEDRWAIAAYIRALQLSQSIPASELSEYERFKLPPKAAAATPGSAGTGGTR
jgi:mono/diheme cytochrome c family protein